MNGATVADRLTIIRAGTVAATTPAATVADQFTITYLGNDLFHVCMPDARRGSDRQGTHVRGEDAAKAWCVRTWKIHTGQLF